MSDLDSGNRGSKRLPETITGCGTCGSELVEVFLEPAEMSLADRLLANGDVGKAELTFPLMAAIRKTRRRAQITEAVDREAPFANRFPHFRPFLRSCRGTRGTPPARRDLRTHAQLRSGPCVEFHGRERCAAIRSPLVGGKSIVPVPTPRIRPWQTTDLFLRIVV